MYLLFDIGGTKIRLAVSTDHQTLSEPIAISTPTDFDQAMTQFQAAAEKLTQQHKLLACAGGVRALDPTKTTLLKHPHLPLWEGQPLKERLLKLLNCPVYLENDAAMAGLGEALKGAGQGKKIVAYLTIGTGVGGARIIDGQIDQASLGFEPGHQIIESHPQPTDLESLIAGSALEKKYHQKPEEIDNPKVWEEVVRNLAIGLNNIIVEWSPEIIILGGSVTNKIPFEKLQAELSQILKIFPTPPPIVKASLGDSAGLVGALQYLRRRVS